MIDFKGSRFEREIVLWGVRWYVAYPISYRQLEEMMEERGVEVDRAAIESYIQRGARHRDRDPPGQVPQQRCRTGPSSDQASSATDDGVQVLLVDRRDPCWH